MNAEKLTEELKTTALDEELMPKATIPKATMKELLDELKSKGFYAAMVARGTGISVARFYNLMNGKASRFDTTEVEAVAKFKVHMLGASVASASGQDA